MAQQAQVERTVHRVPANEPMQDLPGRDKQADAVVERADDLLDDITALVDEAEAEVKAADEALFKQWRDTLPPVKRALLDFLTGRCVC